MDWAAESCYIPPLLHFCANVMWHYNAQSQVTVVYGNVLACDVWSPCIISCHEQLFVYVWAHCNKWSKNLNEKLHRRWRIIHGDNVTWCRPVRSTAVGCHAVIEDWMIPFTAYTAAETPNAFQWARRFPNIAPSRGGISTHLTHGSLGQPPKRHLDRFSRFCRAHPSSMWLAYRPTDTCSNEPYLCIALDAV